MFNFIESILILLFASKGLKNKIRFIFYLLLNLVNKLKIVDVKIKDFKMVFKDVTFWIGLSSAELSSYIEIFAKTIYEQQAGFKAKDGEVIFDIGSNIGLFVIRQASKVGPNGKIWAFEPNPFVFNRLIKNLGENNILNAVAIQKAVTSKVGKMKFSFNINITPEGRSLHSEELDKNKNMILEVECITLDNFVIENSIRKINLLKIDVEGEECEVLKGASEKALSITEKIVLEYHGEEIKENLIQLLKNKNFSLILDDDKNRVLYFLKSKV